MKTFLLILILAMPLMLFSQIDSTELYFKSVDNDDIRTICELADIQIIKIISKDTLLKNKVFNFIIKEFKKGKIVSSDDLNISNKVDKTPIVVNGDTLIHVVHMLEKAGFSEGRDSLLITISGIYKNDIFKLYIQYPGIKFSKNLKGKKNYLLREAIKCSENKIKVPVNKEYPILVYTPPFADESPIQSYCILLEENVEKWCEKFKVKHFFGIYLEIK
jgi:hypothetical protein